MQLYWSQCRALLFMNSLQPDYTHFYDKYNYLKFLFEMAKAWYNVSASSQLNIQISYFVPPTPVLFWLPKSFLGFVVRFCTPIFFPGHSCCDGLWLQAHTPLNYWQCLLYLVGISFKKSFVVFDYFTHIGFAYFFLECFSDLLSDFPTGVDKIMLVFILNWPN